MSANLVSSAYAQTYAATIAAYSAGRHFTPWRPAMAHYSCCFEGAER